MTPQQIYDDFNKLESDSMGGYIWKENPRTGEAIF